MKIDFDKFNLSQRRHTAASIVLTMLIISGCATVPSWPEIEASYRNKLLELDEQYHARKIDVEEYKMKYQIIYQKMQSEKKLYAKQPKNLGQSFFDGFQEAQNPVLRVKVEE